MTPLFLDTVMKAFTHLLTLGFLNVHPWVMNMMAGMLTILLILGYGLVALHPTPASLELAGAVTLRAMVLFAIANNWLTITDGFLNSVVWLGMQVGGSTLSPAEFLSPGRVFYLGTALSWNILNIMLDLKTGLFWEPVLGIAYVFAWLVLWSCFAMMACYVLFAVIEFQLLSVYAFLMWPFMSVRLLAFLAEPLARSLLASALRISALATLMTILVPFVIEVGIPGGDLTVQSAMSLAFGVIVLGVIIWQGPRQIGGSAWPGTSLVTLGGLTWMAMRR